MKTDCQREVRSACRTDAMPSATAPLSHPWSQVPPGAMMEFDLAELEESSVSHLRTASTSWLSSLGFATLYAQPPATHVWIRLGEQSQIAKACFFFERPWKGRLKLVHVFGPTDMTPDEILDLLQRRRASVATISCMAADDTAQWGGPWHRWSERRVNEDIIVDLPRSEAEYLSSLGRNAKIQLPYYLRKLQKELGSAYTVFSLAGPQITLAAFQELVELNRVRIGRKGVPHLWGAELVRQRWELAQSCGLFCGIRRGDELLAGTMSYLHRNEAYFVLIGHNMDFDRLRLGKLVLWLTIQRLIQLGVPRYHMLWGMSPYKLQLGGTPRPLMEVGVFRHPLVAVLWVGTGCGKSALGVVTRLARLPFAVWRRIVTAMRSCAAPLGSL